MLYLLDINCPWLLPDGFPFRVRFYCYILHFSLPLILRIQWVKRFKRKQMQVSRKNWCTAEGAVCIAILRSNSPECVPSRIHNNMLPGHVYLPYRMERHKCRIFQLRHLGKYYIREFKKKKKTFHPSRQTYNEIV